MRLGEREHFTEPERPWCRTGSETVRSRWRRSSAGEASRSRRGDGAGERLLRGDGVGERLLGGDP